MPVASGTVAAEARWFTDAVQEVAFSRRVRPDAWNRGGYVTPSFPDAWAHAASPVLFYPIPRDGDCVGDIDVWLPRGAARIVDAAIYFDGRILWSGGVNGTDHEKQRLPLGGINMHGTRGHDIHVLLKNVPDSECPPRVTATFRCHEPRGVRLALVERSPMRDLIIPDW